jgi:hypothetical protein
VVARGDGAGEGREDEARVEPEQGLFAVDAVEEKSAEQAGDRGGPAVGGDELAELRRV